MVQCSPTKRGVLTETLHNDLGTRYVPRREQKKRDGRAISMGSDALGTGGGGGGASLNKRVEDASSAPRGGSGDQFLR